MNKVLKSFAITLGIILITALIGFIILVTFVSPNRLKPLITAQVKKYTGREMVIDGDLSWTMFPSLGVKVGHLELNNPTGFKEVKFAEIQSATVGVRLLPLLRSKIESSGITLKGLKLNLITNAAGKTNWEDFSGNTSAPTTQDPVQKSSSSRNALGLAITGVDVSNATINWINEKTAQTMVIDHFNLQAKNINLTEPFLFTTSFNFNNPQQSVAGKVELKSKIALNLAKQMYFFNNINLRSQIKKQAQNLNINIEGDATADLNQDKIVIDNLKAQLANLKMTGKINIADFSNQLKANGQLRLHPFDIKKLLQEIGSDVPALQSLSKLRGNFEFNAGNTLSSLELKGDMKADEATITHLHLHDLAMEMKMTKSVMTLPVINADLYSGRLDGQLKIDLTSDAPKISLQGKLLNIQSEPLLGDLAKDQKIKVAGTGNVDLEITTAGNSKEAILKSLNGTAKMTFNQGVLKGIDLGYLVDSAIALANKQPMPANQGDQTEFGTLTATSIIRNGVLTNNDFYLNSRRFDTRGEGSINLVEQQINYRLQSSVKQTGDNQKNTLANLYGYAIPVSVKGNLDSPAITLDMQGLMKAIAKQELQKAKVQVQEKLQEQLTDKIPGKAGELLNNLLGG